ncbi:MAG: inositol monophosphatase, partial [Nitrospira sp.]|nr:inositol monophosphatase [Nitrospira sp.]
MLSSADHVPVSVLLDVAVAAGKKAGAILQDCTRSGFHIEHKNPINLVTDADHAAERCVIDHIHARFPTHSVLAEEQGRIEQAPSPYLWIID